MLYPDISFSSETTSFTEVMDCSEHKAELQMIFAYLPLTFLGSTGRMLERDVRMDLID